MGLTITPVDNRPRTITKIAAGAGSTIGVAAALGSIAKKRGMNLKQFRKIELNEINVIKIASYSTAGGFLAGGTTDRKNIKAKAKEGIVQLIGNYIIPSLSVGAGIKLNKALNKKYNFPPITKPIQFAFGMTSLVLGVIAGNKITSQRPLNWKDWGEQADNVCLVTSMSTSGTKLAKTASKIIPFAHLVPGYLTGIKTGS